MDPNPPQGQQILTGTQNVLVRNEVGQGLWPVLLNPEIGFNMRYDLYTSRVLLHAEKPHSHPKQQRKRNPSRLNRATGLSQHRVGLSPRGHLSGQLAVVTVQRVLVASVE